jgi:tetratricopeptide (TPR) repeat protein
MMSQVDQLRAQAQNLRKGKKYEEARALYELMLRDHQGECDKWDRWGYAYCLRKLGRAEEAVAISQEVYEANPDFDYIKNLYGWSLYDLEISKSTEEIAQDVTPFFEAVNTILEISDPQNQYSPYVRTVMKVIEYFSKRATYASDKVIEWTEKLDANSLSLETSSGKNKKGKIIEYPSDRERWYAWLCKALYESGRFEECIALSDEAFQVIPHFHFDHDIWIRWRRALAKGQIGHQDEAIAELKSILQVKHDWFFQRDVARYLYEVGRLDEALEYAASAALDRAGLEFKWELFLLMAQILEAQSELEKARKHVLLAAALRQENDWKASEELDAMLDKLDVDAQDASSRKLSRQLKSFWRSLKFRQMAEMTGRISNLLPHGKAGFISGDDGNDYYFKTRSFQGPRHRIQRGTHVQFRVKENPNPDQRDMALDITEAEKSK